MQMRTLTTLAALAIAATGCGPSEVPEEASEPAAIAAEVPVTGGVVRSVLGDDGLKQYQLPSA